MNVLTKLKPLKLSLSYWKLMLIIITWMLLSWKQRMSLPAQSASFQSVPPQIYPFQLLRPLPQWYQMKFEYTFDAPNWTPLALSLTDIQSTAPRRCNWASQCTDYFFGLTVKKRRIGEVDVNDNIISKTKVTLIIPSANKRYFIKVI